MFKKTFILLISLVLMYGIIPLKISEIIGSEFLIGDFVDSNLFPHLIIFSLGSAFFLSPMLKKKITLPSLNSYGKFAEKTGFRIYFLYLFFLIFLGLFLRLKGTDRSALLSILSSTFIQGMGVILILFYLRFIKSHKRIILLVSIMFGLIDILFMGKQYFISLITILIFLADFNSFKFKIIHYFLIFSVSILFMFFISFSRGDFSQIDLFSSLMEFRGVISSIQFASNDVSVFELNSFRAKVESDCFDIYGYNLAFHPLMYFRSITNYTSVAIILYSLFIYSLFKLMIKTIGAYAILIISLNFIHFLRHGIDLFLIKIFFQFLIVLMFIVNFDIKKSNLN